MARQKKDKRMFKVTIEDKDAGSTVTYDNIEHVYIIPMNIYFQELFENKRNSKQTAYQHKFE